MTRRNSFIASYLLSIAVLAMAGSARASLIATVRDVTGDLRIKNVGATDFHIFAYSVTDATAQLRTSNWQAVTDRLDADGDMSLDPDDSWIVLSPSPPIPPSVNELSEAVFTGAGGVLPPGGHIYLGGVWDANSASPIELMVADETQDLMNVPVLYLAAGDYNEDGIVNAADYSLWRASVGSTGTGLWTDGDGNGVVNVADYTLWRDNLGATIFTPPLALGLSATSTAIPEPGSLAGVVLAALTLLGLRYADRPIHRVRPRH